MQTATSAGPAGNPNDAIAPHIADIKRALGSKGAELDDREVADELRKYLEYGVPIEQAVRTILRHHGIQPQPRVAAPTSTERVTLASLPPVSPAVNLKVRVLSLNTKSVKARGEDKDVIWGLLGDETGTAPYSSWRPLEGVAKGDVLEIRGAYTKEYQGKAQVNFGDRTQLSKLAPDALPRTPDTVRDANCADLKDGMRGVRMTGRVLSIAARQVTVQGQPRTVWGGQIADASGQVEFSAWSDPQLQPNQVVTIEGGYVRAFRGVPQLTFDADARITPFTADFPDALSLSQRPPMKLRDLVSRGGGSDITIHGVLLDIKEGSGLVMRCSTPGCTRVLAAGICRIHNKVEPVPDLRIKAVIDDGTGAVSLVAGRELTEAFLGKNLEECKKEAQAAFRPQIIQEQLAERLTGRPVTARGNALGDEYGITFIARSLEARHEDTKTAAQGIITNLEVA